MQSAENKKFIDIDAIFKAKNPGLYRILPRFIFSYLKRVAHQDDINDFIIRNGHRQELYCVYDIFDEFLSHI